MGLAHVLLLAQSVNHLLVLLLLGLAESLPRKHLVRNSKTKMTNSHCSSAAKSSLPHNSDLLSLAQAKQALIFINQRQGNVCLWVRASGVQDGESTERTTEIHIRSQSLEITLHGRSVFHTPLKNPMTFSAGVDFAAAWGLVWLVGCCCVVTFFWFVDFWLVFFYY